MNQEKFSEQFFHKRFDNQPNSSPITTISYYCPDDKTAAMVTVRIIDSKNEIMELRHWFVQIQDVRIDRAINNEILSFIKEHNVQCVALAGRIIGYPHEEGTNYHIGSTCPQCLYWVKLDRWTGEVLKL